MSRASWDTYFLDIAKTVATRATCDRKHVGAVIVRDKMILATGYNGSIRGMPHCDEVGHMMEDGHCVRTMHAEANAIVQAARAGVQLHVERTWFAENGSKLYNEDKVLAWIKEVTTIYVTASPCWPCFKLIANAGISRIVFGEFYRDERIFDVAKKLNIELVDANEPEVGHCGTDVVHIAATGEWVKP